MFLGQEALTWASQHYQLNPRREEFEHQAWAITESSLHRALAGYCLDRFQRYRHARPISHVAYLV
ncbi:unnamed protein product [Effrenium voratum]|nr:unnamed protein product [Effrenium voratum]